MNIVFQSRTEEELLSEFHQLAAVKGQEFAAQIAAAQSSNDIALMQELQIQMQNYMEELTAAYQESLAQSGDHDDLSLFNDGSCTLDLDLAVYDGDRDYVLEFRRDPDVARCKNELNENGETFQSRRALLKRSLRLTPSLAPTLYEIGEKCRNIIGLKADIEFYVYQDTAFNASCYPPEDSRLYIMLTSGLLEKFTEGELLFVIGHEIGHALFKHFDYSITAMMENGRDYLSTLHAMKLYAWSRNSEISADRIGLLCCRDYEVAAQTFFKLSSGVTDTSIEFKLNEYIKQFLDLQDILSDSSQVEPEDWYSSHPFGPLRIKALHLFSESETFYKLLGESGGTLSEEEMEAQIKSVLALMEPTYIDESSDHGTTIQEFIFICGYVISLSDGEVHPSELQALSTLVSVEMYKKCLDEVAEKDLGDLKVMISEKANEIRILLSPVQRLNIIRDLAIITYADGRVDQAEVDTLYGICYYLGINGEFADRILSEMEEENNT